MPRPAAIYLAHLNPMTRAHEEIISLLKKKYKVYIFPVRFLLDGFEVNTRSFPFPYEIRKSMVESVFGANDVLTLPDYTFFSPFIKYLPPLVSPFSWMLRNKIVKAIKEDVFISYTGDTAERIAMTVYMLHPIKSKRLQISASQVKEMIYSDAIYKKNRDKIPSEYIEQNREYWYEKVPPKVADIIKENWKIIERFAHDPDNTVRITGMKFPKKGLF